MRNLPATPALLHDDRLVVLALHTIERGAEAEIGAVAVLNRHGAVLLHTRIRPTYPIPALRDALPLDVVWPTLAALLTNRIIVGFHVAADRRVLRQTARRLGATVMYNEWRCVGALGQRSSRMPALHPHRAALTEACTAFAALRAQAPTPPYPTPPPRVFWRYL